MMEDIHFKIYLLLINIYIEVETCGEQETPKRETYEVLRKEQETYREMK